MIHIVTETKFAMLQKEYSGMFFYRKKEGLVFIRPLKKFETQIENAIKLCQ
jgi:hypothetical protein